MTAVVTSNPFQHGVMSSTYEPLAGAQYLTLIFAGLVSSLRRLPLYVTGFGATQTIFRWVCLVFRILRIVMDGEWVV